MCYYFLIIVQKKPTLAVIGEASWDPRMPASFAVCREEVTGAALELTAGFICLLFRSQCLIKTLLYFLFILDRDRVNDMSLGEKRKEKMKSCRCYRCDHVGASSLYLSLTHSLYNTLFFSCIYQKCIGVLLMRNLLEQNLNI